MADGATEGVAYAGTAEHERNREGDNVGWRFAMSRKACVVGSGPNGLAAAIVLAQAGLQVDVFEAEPTAGGAARTMELTLPGFLHDFGSAVHPLGAGSPFFSSLPLKDHGLEWIHSPAPLAHPLDDGTAVLLERKLSDANTVLGADGNAWVKLVRPFVEHWSEEFGPEVLRPVFSIPKYPWLMARFGMNVLLSARTIARRFQSAPTRALFAGLAAHSFLSLDELLSGAFGMLMAVPAHAVGWPIARGGSQSLTNALCGYLATFGAKVKTSSRVESLASISQYELILCDVTPRQLLAHGRSPLIRPLQTSAKKVSLWPRSFQSRLRLKRPHPVEGFRSACARRPFTWAGALRKLLHRNRRYAMGDTRSLHLLCSLSPVYLILRAPLRANTRRGRIATCLTGRRWTC